MPDQQSATDHAQHKLRRNPTST